MFIEYMPKSLKNDDGKKSVATHTLILGLGATGLSCARYLTAQGHQVIVNDSRLQPPGLKELKSELPEVNVKLGTFDVASLLGVHQLIVSPGVALEEEIVQRALDAGIPVLGDIELFARAAKKPTIGITGSNGKSTVTAWVAFVMNGVSAPCLAGGNLSPPALDLLSQDEPDVYALELSSFQLETTVSLACDIAVLLNISPDHIDRHGTFDSYAKAKARIFRNARIAVVNRDDEQVMAVVPPDLNVVSVGLSKPPRQQDFGLVQAGDDVWFAKGDKKLIPAGQIPFAGKHNWLNALTVLAICDAFGLAMSPVLRMLVSFKGLPHRMQVVANHKGVTWINDSKGTNVGATVAAVTGAEGPVVLIAGGDSKNADFAPLAQAAKDRVRACVLLGKDAPAIAAVLEPWCPVIQVPDMRQAVSTAARFAQSGDVVLLSPACASLDMFRDYVERGEVFTRLVEESIRG